MPTPLLAAKLVELRNQHGLSQLQVAEFLGINNHSFLSDYSSLFLDNLEMLHIG